MMTIGRTLNYALDAMMTAKCGYNKLYASRGGRFTIPHSPIIHHSSDLYEFIREEYKRNR